MSNKPCLPIQAIQATGEGITEVLYAIDGDGRVWRRQEYTLQSQAGWKEVT